MKTLLNGRKYPSLQFRAYIQRRLRHVPLILGSFQVRVRGCRVQETCLEKLDFGLREGVEE
jgi:hypothetical protein